MIIDVRLEQLKKALRPIDVTLFPMKYSFTCVPKIFFMEELELYAFDTIALLFISTSVRLEQPEKALSPIDVMFFPMVTDVIL